MKKNVVFSLLGAAVFSSAMWVNAGNPANSFSSLCTQDNGCMQDSTHCEPAKCDSSKCDSTTKKLDGISLLNALASNDSIISDSANTKNEKTLAYTYVNTDSIASDTTKTMPAKSTPTQAETVSSATLLALL